MLTVKNLRVAYGPVVAVENISMNVNGGEIVSLIGANGAGKTSVIRAISRLIPSSGQILLNGKDISNLQPQSLCPIGLATVPEGRHVFPQLTVEENLLLGAHASSAGRQNLKAGLDQIYHRFPRLLERRNQLAGTLSGGEQQMLALGRAVISRPHTLLLDEPSMGLAPKLIPDIFGMICSLRDSGIAILLVEQNASLALEVSSYVYLLENGKCRMEGKANMFMNNVALQSAYLGK